MNIRPARPADAEEMSLVLCASIRELCNADHGGDPDIIASWTANKTPGAVAGWLDTAGFKLLVAEEDRQILGVGGFFDGGEIVLNYVTPRARLSGVSKALLAHMETELAAAGIGEGRLDSTGTAHRFYRAAGWQDAGPAQEKFGLPCHPMTKRLGTPS